MTTATRRLRRASIAGLAAFVTAGGVVLGTATSAFAAELTVTTQIGSVTATTVYPGATATGVGDLQISVPNSFHIGDTITVQLAGAAASCGTTNGAVGYAATPTVGASGPVTAAFGSTAGNSADTTPSFTTALQSSAGACTIAGVKDQLLITVTNSSTGTAGNFYTITVSGTKINVGTAVGTGAVTETPAGGGGNTVATVSNTKVSMTETSAAPSSSAVGLGTVTMSEVSAGAALPTGATTVTLTLAGAGTPNFTAGVTPTITVPAGYSTTTPATAAGTTYSFAVTAPATTVAATVTVSGLKVDLTAAGTGVVTLNTNVFGGPVSAIGVLNSSRTGGTDRYATSAQLFNQNAFVGGANNVAVLASGANYPDALSANYLAAGLNSNAGTRVLLTEPTFLPQPTSQALITGGIKTVYIVGGTAAVSQAVQTQIAAMHVGNNTANAFINVIRVAGADRYATNNMVDLYNGASGVSTAFVATGTNFADALSIAPAVVKSHIPLVLTSPGALSSAAQSTLVNLGIKNVVILGGTSAVSAAVETSIKNLGITIAYRLAGADRTATASMVATYETTATATAAFPATSAYSALNGLGYSNAAAYVARGDGFADALSAGAVAGGVGGSTVGPIVLTANPTTLGGGIPTYFSGKAATLTTITILGLTSAVSVGTANAAIASIS